MALFEKIEESFFRKKKEYDEGGLSNTEMKLWDDLYDTACSINVFNSKKDNPPPENLTFGD